MRISKNKSFCRLAKEIGITNFQLKQAVHELEQGLYEANLGGNIYKKREGTWKSCFHLCLC